jgi:hypothetical protein
MKTAVWLRGWRHVDWYEFTNASVVCTAPIIRAMSRRRYSPEDGRLLFRGLFATDHLGVSNTGLEARCARCKLLSLGISFAVPETQISSTGSITSV